MRPLIALAALAALGSASAAMACDVGPFPDRPADMPADAIGVGRAVKVTQAFDAKGKAQGSAEVAIERVATGEFTQKTWRLDYPVATPEDYCVYGTGPELRLGQTVAVYFRRVAGELVVADWFFADEAARADPRLAKTAPRP